MLRISAIRKARAAKRQAGFVVTAELLLITTILGLGLITGFTKVRDQVLAELSDTGSAIGAINQSYTMKGTTWHVDVDGGGDGPIIAEVSGFAFQDESDPQAVNQVGGDYDQISYLPAPDWSFTGKGYSETEGATGGINQH